MKLFHVQNSGCKVNMSPAGPSHDSNAHLKLAGVDQGVDVFESMWRSKIKGA
jgi:hypothetical protein